MKNWKKRSIVRYISIPISTKYKISLHNIPALSGKESLNSDGQQYQQNNI
jgi:hypothetical protein